MRMEAGRNQTWLGAKCTTSVAERFAARWWPSFLLETKARFGVGPPEPLVLCIRGTLSSSRHRAVVGEMNMGIMERLLGKSGSGIACFKCGKRLTPYQPPSGKIVVGGQDLETTELRCESCGVSFC